MNEVVLPPLNLAAYEDARRNVREILAAAERGHEASRRLLICMAAAPALEANLLRIAAFADVVAPTLDQIKIERGAFTSDACKLRYELELVHNVLNQAAGRAVVVPLPSQDASDDAQPETGSAA